MTENSFTVRAGDVRAVRRIDDGAADAPLAAGEVRLRVGPFALTSNNVTYGVLGRAMGYFGFYPAAGADEGRIPVWGFASVVESTVPDLAVGERFYGYYPPSSHAILRPVRVTPEGFTDGAEHRRNLPPVYNQYTNTSRDPGYAREREGEIAIFRPLFATAFLLDDFFAERSFFGAESVVLSSASSKTALATAYFLAARRAAGGPRVIGLTSKVNQPFVERLGTYDDVVLYDDAASIPAAPAVYLDFSGDAVVKQRVHAHLGDSLRHSAIIGATHWDVKDPGTPLPGPSPSMFFAPAHVRKRIADWGGERELRARIASSSAAFLERATREGDPWLRIVRESGLDAVLASYAALLAGSVPADAGHVLTI